MTGGARDASFRRVGADGGETAVTRAVPIEAPVAIEVDGIGYAVLMATPTDLVDLAWGFALTERLIDSGEDVVDVDVHAGAGGTIVRLALAPRVRGRIADRVRHRTADSSCGLCGIESLEQALRPLPPLTTRWRGEAGAVFAAAAALRDAQPLGRATGATHAAAQADAHGALVRVREDVGRHNAFDKLIGAMLRAGAGWDDGFALLSSRCSYELVEKAVLAGCPMLATISAASDLALARAADAGLVLHTLVRPDALLAIGQAAP